MRKEIREKKKALNNANFQFALEVLKYVQSLNLTKFAYLQIRDQVFEEVYDAQINQQKTQNIYKKGYEEYFNKKTRLMPKKNFFEKFLNLFSIFFFLFFILVIVVYLIRLSSTDDTLFYARGMYLYASLSNLGLMSAYGFLGSIVALFIQKLDKKTKYRQLAIVTLIGLVCVGLLFGFSSIYADAIKINIIFLLLILMVLAIGFYFLENLISQKKYQNYLKSKEEKTKD